MDFAIPESLTPILARMREFVDAHVIPVEAAFHEADDFSAVEARMVEVRAKAKAAGLWLPQMSERHGGMGLSLLEHGLVSEVLGRSPLGHYAFNCQAPDAGNMEILAEYGTKAQRETFLEPLLAGETRSCFAMTEPGRAGSNPVWLETRARVEGDTITLDGHKWFTTAADGAAFAIVMAVTEPDAAPHERASMIIVPTDTPGFTLVRNIPIMGEAGSGWASHAEVRFDDCKVPVTNMLGMPGAGFFIAQARLGPGRIHHCMRWLGICDRAFSMMCERAATRELSPGKFLGEKQTIQNWIAESRAEIDSARLAVLYAAWRIDAVGQKAARVEVSAIKFHVAKILRNVLERAIQTHGALGITDDTVLSFFYRHERGAQIYDGPDEVHKSVVAREVLKTYGMDPRAVALARKAAAREGDK
ncbi:acyl-CoA dehydrogenase domain protein [Plesiocystis pacifica SIR-1]|uniref:Acyl-CoA dehydrogenase domain protein n=1 Tax=Plesiocystis pacifica SIR-1 TaxID=391625 RepID=A6G2X1_9BACT|nr:acyl-CoA dehydrogenase family protein [Plesiocystis pacifica]EDM79821.1 acyl-CoA dehydrogenase domain protein [Plesiocystis pacifica SIR-1]